MDGVKSAEAVEAVAKAQEAVEVSRHSQITEIVEAAVKPVRDEQERVREVLVNLATRDDLDRRFKKIEDFVDGFNLTVKVGAVVGKYGMKTLTILVTIVIGIGVLTGGIKGLIAAIAAWAFGK